MNSWRICEAAAFIWMTEGWGVEQGLGGGGLEWRVGGGEAISRGSASAARFLSD